MAAIQGIVTLRVSTDGKRVSSIDSETGPYALVLAARENLKTWEFESHKPTSFDVRFIYKLSPAPPCETAFDPWDPRSQSVLLQLPMSVELNWVGPRICDPSVVEEKK
jgi:hypothetical protein